MYVSLVFWERRIDGALQTTNLLYLTSVSGDLPTTAQYSRGSRIAMQRKIATIASKLRIPTNAIYLGMIFIHRWKVRGVSFENGVELLLIAALALADKSINQNMLDVVIDG